jgi:nitrate/nitrite transporter NarK
MGNITVYFVSYYRLILNYKEVDDDTFYAIHPTLVLIATVFYPIGNCLVDYFGHSRPVIALGGSMAILASTACVYIEMDPAVFIVVYSFGMGVFKGMLTSALLRAGWSHLPQRKGLVSGCIISGYGFGGFLFGNFANYLANPYNLKYGQDGPVTCLPPEVGARVPYMLKILTLTWLLQILVGLLCITNYTKP